MWVFCCGMQRSGSTLQFQIAAHLAEEAGVGKRVEWMDPERFPELRRKYESDQVWKVFKNHICTDEMAAEFLRQNAVGLYVFRDLRDVVTSVMRKYSMTFDQLLRLRFLEECLDNFQKWTRLPRVLVSKYEDMVADLPQEVGRIAGHLGIPITAEKCKKIAQNYTVERQIERIEEAKKKGKLQKGSARDTFFDPDSNLHVDHIRSGKVKGWEDFLTREQVAVIENKAGDWLIRNGYDLTLSSYRRRWLEVRYQQQRNARAVGRRLNHMLTSIRSRIGV